VPLVPFFIIGISSGLLTSWVEKKWIGAQGSMYDYSIIERCLIAGRVIFFYLGKLCFPHDLMFIYPRWTINQGAAWQYAFPAMIPVLIGIFWLLRKRWRAPLAVFLYFTGMLFPVLGFLSVYPFRYSFVADHFQYLAGLGPIVMAGVCISKALASPAKQYRLPALAAVVLLLPTLGLLSREQARMYVDAETLFKTTIRKNPGCWMAYNNLGVLFAKKGNVDEGIIQFQKSLELNPHGVNAMRNMATGLAQKGRRDEAIPMFRRALHLADSLGEQREARQITALLKRIEKVLRQKEMARDTLPE
jgi:tetratricopeptide (TPR) repeat protein